MHIQGLRDPGSDIDQNNPGAALGDLYFRGSGTSEAAAYVTGAVALLLQRDPQLTPDQVKQMLARSARKLRGAPAFVQGQGELDLSKLLRTAPALHPHPGPGGLAGPPGPGHGPGGAGSFQWSTGSGSLELSRGGFHLTMNGVVLQGDEDIFGMPFDSTAMAALEAAHSSWSGGKWNGSVWTGSSWSGSSWSGSSWSGSSWSGSSWSGSSWSNLGWSGNTWNGSSWSGSSWSGSSWSGSSWSGSSWSGSVWAGDQWLGASWG
jgi:serine protease AprX